MTARRRLGFYDMPGSELLQPDHGLITDESLSELWDAVAVARMGNGDRDGAWRAMEAANHFYDRKEDE